MVENLFFSQDALRKEEDDRRILISILDIMRKIFSFFFLLKIHAPNLYNRDLKSLSNFWTKKRWDTHVQTKTKERRGDIPTTNLWLCKKERLWSNHTSYHEPFHCGLSPWISHAHFSSLGIQNLISISAPNIPHNPHLNRLKGVGIWLGDKSPCSLGVSLFMPPNTHLICA